MSEAYIEGIENKYVELTEKPIVLWMPEDAVEISIEAKVWMGDEIKKCQKKLNFAELRDAFKDAEENYIDPDATFVLTDKGREFVEESKRRGEI